MQLILNVFFVSAVAESIQIYFKNFPTKFSLNPQLFDHILLVFELN